MPDFSRLNLLQAYTFYLAALFLLGTLRRLRQYHDVTALAVALPNRWPNVFRYLKHHSLMLATWTTLRPAALALGLLLVQAVCSRVIWPRARLTLPELAAEWWTIPVVAATGAAVLAVDLYFLLRVGRIDRAETEKYLDEAEHWLTSWKAPVVRWLTLGFVNPRKMVDDGVRQAVLDGGGLIRRLLWWVSVQSACCGSPSAWRCGCRGQYCRPPERRWKPDAALICSPNRPARGPAANLSG